MQTSPKYLQVAQDILSAIESGDFGVGEVLPSEAQLCAHYGVSRITARAAMHTLSERGLVRRRPGVGTHVLRKTSASRFVHTSDSVDSVLQFTESTQLQVLSHQWQAPTNTDDASADEASAAKGRKLVVRALRLDPQARPICLSEFHFSALHQSILGHLPGLKGSLVLRMETLFGVTLHSIDQEFEACKLSARQARELQAKPGEAAMRVRRWHRDAKGEVLIHSVNLYPSDRYTYRLHMQRRSGAGEP